MTARLPLVAIPAAILTVGGVRGAPTASAAPPTNTYDGTTYDYTAYVAELRQRPALAEVPPQVLCELGDIAGTTIRDGGTQNQAADALEQRGITPYDASWITVAALVGVCSDQIAGTRADAGVTGTVAQLTEDNR
jgi:hypothetical protein